MALGIVPGDLELVTMAFANLKMELDKESTAQIPGQVELDVLTQAVKY
jgi:hypothetical protein